MKSLKRIVQVCIAITALVVTVAGNISTTSAYFGSTPPPSGKAATHRGGW